MYELLFGRKKMLSFDKISTDPNLKKLLLFKKLLVSVFLRPNCF